MFLDCVCYVLCITDSLVVYAVYNRIMLIKIDSYVDKSNQNMVALGPLGYSFSFRSQGI